MSETTVYPEWRHALQQFLDAGFSYGDRIDDEWFYHAFSIEIPEPDMPAWKVQKLELARLRNFEALRRWLLAEHMMLLDRKGGVITVVRPAEQTAYTMNDFIASMTKEFTRAGERLRGTALDLLDDEQRCKHADACASLARLKGLMIVGRRRLPQIE
jgi:hypothetical protein